MLSREINRDIERLVLWLMQNGGPVIQYRTATELAGDLDVDVAPLEQKLLESKDVNFWLDKLISYEVRIEQTKKRVINSSFMHGSRDFNIEVVLPKLAQLGLHAGMNVLDERTDSWLQVLEQALEASYDDIYADDKRFLSQVYLHYDNQIVVGASLALAGYYDSVVQTHLNRRLNSIYETVKAGTYDIYEEPSKYDIHPGEWGDHILKWQLYHDGDIKLPFVHDVFGFAIMYRRTNDMVITDKIDTVIRWILRPEHQRLCYNFGYIRAPHGLGKSVGWKVDLPGYEGFDLRFDPIDLLIRCWMMAHFKPARNHQWFTNCIKHLESFVTNKGTYIFPSRYITERGNRGYWVFGARMGLGENRRRRVWRELESTFWMLKIKSVAGLLG